MKQNDKAGTPYWDKNWVNSEFPQPFDHTDTTLNNYVNQEMHSYFQKLFGDKRGFSVLEIGCANSVWPVYFYTYFGAKVYGLDYSEIGCEKSRELLEHHKIPGEVFCADLFSPPKDLTGKFDFVMSFGVVEHFENTSECLKACSAFVKHGGKLFTQIPNLTGIIGFLQKIVDREVYDVHVPLDSQQLAFAHKQAGLNLEQCDYFMFLNLNVLNSGSFANNTSNKVLRRFLSIVSKAIWAMEKKGLRLPRNRLTSPYVMALARC